MSQNVVTLTGVKKLYKMGSEIVAALNGVDLRIDQGEFVALMGPSGSGKSTLMNILGCLDRPTEGSYKLLSQEVSHLSDDELAAIRNKTIGFVFQNFNLLPKLTSVENVALPAVYAGIKTSQRMAMAQEALEKKQDVKSTILVKPLPMLMKPNISISIMRMIIDIKTV